ncbi:MAG TPA: hypothetical protein VG106_10075 [Vicinamibacterales bacterium]|nr:hypothetical protein [Vicinamibacterales bacterium]
MRPARRLLGQLARRFRSDVLFLSTSRVYPFGLLNAIELTENAERFEIAETQTLPGITRAGISEAFPLDGARTLYGATKLASELLLHEYGDMYGLHYAHRFNRPLAYIGWGGEGKQVRDLLYIDDLCELLDLQLERGPEAAASLRETTRMCEIITGNQLNLRTHPENRPGDVRLYITDNGRATPSSSHSRRSIAGSARTKRSSRICGRTERTLCRLPSSPVRPD